MRLPFGIYFILGLLLCIQSEHLIKAQSRRPSTIARSLGVNPKGSATSDAFECPEEFGYYPHPSDCSQYYVCVFGGALLESCTGGLMYSHELQTCDWPRNVGCEASDENVSSSGSGRQQQHHQQQQQQQHHSQQQQHDAYHVVPSKFRFSSVSSTPQSERYPESIPIRHSSVAPITPQPQTLAPISNTLPPPPEPFHGVQPNPVITSRGQPKPLDNIDIAKLYSEAHDTLPPIEEEESDRQQRVYRGQPSTVGQVQRDRDGLITQHVNGLPSHGKVGSFSFGSQINQHRVESSSQLPSAPENNRNYYNATSNQEYNNPTQYNSYFSVYDDEAEDTGDLYRDDYPTQYNSNRNPSQPKYVQTTYRPSTVTTQTQSTSTKNVVPQRESYVSNSKPTYEQSVPAHEAYNPEYDEALVAQLEADNEYDQPTKTQIRTNNRNRGSSHFTSGNYDERTPSGPTANRGTHPPRSRPTLKPSGAIVSKATEFKDIYQYPPTRPEPLYPQPIPDKTAAKCRKDVCLLPDCYCGGRDIPGDMPVEDVPQIVLLTFDDSVNDLNKQLYSDLFSKGRVNPNGCPISATFYVSHEWTDYSQVQNLYSDGHEMASHTVSHSFGEQFSQKKWTREVAGQREILAAYGGVKLNDIRGMRAPFLSIGGNKMFKMLYDSNFTYDSSMPVYENRPPSWPYTLDYKIFHDCMIPPCPTKSYPGVWQVPMVMWQDLNGGRCSMGDACSNPADSDGVFKMVMKNFDRHYTTNRAPFGLFYHAAWFTQPHHKEGFIKFLDTINSMNDVWIVTNWQALQWVRDPTPLSRMNSFQPFQCNYQDRPKRCNNPKVCNLWHKSGVRYMRTCQPCPDIYPWTGKSGIRSSRVDNDIDE